MSVIFIPQSHTYKSIEDSENIEWTSVTSVVSKFKEKFDAEAIAAKSSKNKKSKWYGMTANDIMLAWEGEAQKAINLGSWYHDQREADLLEFSTISRKGKEVPIIRPITKDGVKYAPNQKLTDGVYPEHMVYLKSAGICGQSDRVEVIDGFVHVSDYKTNKEIKTESYTNWEGISKKMQPPLQHLDDCNFYHYALQLSIYMYMILKHNPKLKYGSLTIEHIIFATDGTDEYHNRILRFDANHDPIIEDVVTYDVPYLKEEVITLINYLKEHEQTK